MSSKSLKYSILLSTAFFTLPVMALSCEELFRRMPQIYTPAAKNFASPSHDIIKRAVEIATERHHERVTSGHLLLALSEKLGSPIDSMKSDIVKTAEASLKELPKVSKESAADSIDPSLVSAITQSVELANYGSSSKDKTVDEKNLLMGALVDLRTSHLSATHVTPLINKIEQASAAHKIPANFEATNPNQKLSTGIDKYTHDLTAKARAGKLSPVIGRSKEIKEVIEVLARRNKNGPVLVGEAGVGKTAVVEGLAMAIAHGDVPDFLKNRRIVSLSMSDLVADTKFRGDFEARVKEIFEEMEASKGEIILFVDELHTIMGAGGTEGSQGFADLLKPYLARSGFPVIGATTFSEYRKIIADPALERRFREIKVEEPTPEQTLTILRGAKSYLEKSYGISISDAALKRAVDLSGKYIKNKHFPDKAFDVLDNALAALKTEQNPELRKVHDRIDEINFNLASLKDEVDAASLAESAILKGQLASLEAQRDSMTPPKEYAQLSDQVKMLKNELAGLDANDPRAQEIRYTELPVAEEKLKPIAQAYAKYLAAGGTNVRLSPEHIATQVSKQSGHAVGDINKSEAQKILELPSTLKAVIKGQDHAIDEIASGIKVARAEITEKTRPITSVILTGPTGVGKTFLAEELALQYFGNKDALVRFDMSEFSEKHTAARLVGSPPGYVGHGEGGELTEKIRRNPHSLVLFDEIEKAHPDVLDMLLQIVENGRLTDGEGRTVDFQNSIVMLTSNVGSGEITTAGSGAKFDPQALRDIFIQRGFKPELINRFDKVIAMNPMSKDVFSEIVTSHLSKKFGDALKKRGIKINFSDLARSTIEEQSFDPELGARPLRRYLDKNIEDPLADRIFDRAIPDNSVIDVNFDKASGKYTFKVTEPK